MNEIKYIETKVTKEIIDLIYDLDKKYYKIKVPKKWYNRYKYATVILAKTNDKIIGYALYSPIKEVAYRAIYNEVFIGDININEEMFVEKSLYHYLASVVIIPEYRRQHIGTELFKKIFDKEDNKSIIMFAKTELENNFYLKHFYTKHLNEMYNIVTNLPKSWL